MNKSYTKIILSEEIDYTLFRKIAEKIIFEFNAEILEKLNSLDSIYWDFKIDSEIVTLHQQTFIGITLFPKELENATEKANTIVEEIERNLK